MSSICCDASNEYFHPCEDLKFRILRPISMDSQKKLIKEPILVMKTNPLPNYFEYDDILFPDIREREFNLFLN